MKDNLLLQSLQLLSQQLAGIKGEEIYQLTACMDADTRELIGLLRAISLLPNIDKNVSKQCSELIPFFSEIGKSKWQRTELTDLGLRVGDRGVGIVKFDSDISLEAEDKEE